MIRTWKMAQIDPAITCPIGSNTPETEPAAAALQVEAGDGLPAGAYGWDGGLGSVWRTDPATDVTVVLLTNRSWLSPEPPPVRDVVIGAFDAVAEG